MLPPKLMVLALKAVAVRSLEIVERGQDTEYKATMRRELEDVAVDMLPSLVRMFEARGIAKEQSVGLAVTAVLTIAASCMTGVVEAGESRR